MCTSVLSQAGTTVVLLCGGGYTFTADILHLLRSDNHCAVPRNPLLTLQGSFMQCDLSSEACVLKVVHLALTARLSSSRDVQE